MTFAAPKNLSLVIVEPNDHQALRLYLMLLPSGSPVCLHGVSGLIWLIAAEGDPDVAGAVADSLGLEAADISHSVESFMRELLAAGLLARVGLP